MCAGMKRTALTLLLALSLALGNATAATTLENTIIEPDNSTIIASLKDYQENEVFKRQLRLPPSSNATIIVTDVPSKFSFVILQIHTYEYNATLTCNKTLSDKKSGESLFGSNIGFYLKTRDVTSPIQVFLEHDNVHDLDALLVIVPYGPNAPIPGGCNMEFEIEIAPYQKLRMDNEMITVDAQPAAAVDANGLSIPCKKNPIQYSMYRIYLPTLDFTPETYFDAISKMLTVQNIVNNGMEIPPAPTISSMRRIYSNYVGTGSVYAVVATYGNYSSAYVPTFSYGCSYLLYPKGCQVLNEVFPRVIAVIATLIGLVSFFFGEKCALLDRLLSKCAIGGFVGYTLAVGAGDPGVEIDILIGLAVAIIAVCVFLCITIRGESGFHIFLSHLPLAFLCSCIAYLYTPARIFYVMEYEWSFWTIFVSSMIMIAMLLQLVTFEIADLFSRAVFTACFVAIGIDYSVGTHLKYIIINIIRRMTVSGFNLAFVYPPFHTEDITIFCWWVIMIVVELFALWRYMLHGRSSTSEERQSLLESTD